MCIISCIHTNPTPEPEHPPRTPFPRNAIVKRARLLWRAQECHGKIKEGDHSALNVEPETAKGDRLLLQAIGAHREWFDRTIRAMAVPDREWAELGALRAGNMPQEEYPRIVRQARERLEDALRRGIEEKEGITLSARTLAELGTPDAERVLFTALTEGIAQQSPHVPRLLREALRMNAQRAAGACYDSLHLPLPHAHFRYLLRLFMEHDILPRCEVMNILDKVEGEIFLRKLIHACPSIGSFTTTLETLQRMDYEPNDREEDFEELARAIHTLGAITPIIFAEYRQAAQRGERECYVEKIQELRRRMFRNEPVEHALQEKQDTSRSFTKRVGALLRRALFLKPKVEVLGKKEAAMLAEAITVSYRPQTMSCQYIQDLWLARVRDRTKDLAPYVFPEDGYKLSLTPKIAVLRKGTTIDENLLTQWKRAMEPEKEGDTALLGKACARMLKGAFDTPKGGKEQWEWEQAMHILRHITIKDAAVPVEGQEHAFLLDLKEKMDPSHAAEVVQKVIELLHSDAETEKLLWECFAARKKRERQRHPPQEKERTVESALAHAITKVLQKERATINGELKKYIEITDPAGSGHRYRAYCSKNIASFFAKDAVHICTNDDVRLFHNKHHFHINVVENDERVVANIQAYIVKVGWKKALVLRGFNPTEQLLYTVTAEQFCDEIIRIGRAFAHANKLKGPYLTAHTFWHELSNRGAVSKVLVQQHLKGKEGIPCNLTVTGYGHTVDKIFAIDTAPPHP